jgi:hypothetical protein
MNTNCDTLWKNIIQVFPNIINNNSKYKYILDHILLFHHNILLYTCKGFPLDLFVNEIMKKKFDIQILNKTQHTWNKSIVYLENQHFFEIDLIHPENSKDLNSISDFVLHIIQSQNIGLKKHFIIIKHIDILSNQFYNFRILLEKYSKNVNFICTTHSLSKIEAPIISRFAVFHIPLFTFEEIQAIFENYTNIELNKYLVEMKTRNLIKAIFIADIEMQEKRKNNNTIITKDFCIYNFPPIYDTLKTLDMKKCILDDIRNLSYKCCQYNVSIIQLVEDLIKIIDIDDTIFVKLKQPRRSNKNIPNVKNETKAFIINKAAEIDALLCQTNKSKEPIYIENFLCQILI